MIAIVLAACGCWFAFETAVIRRRPDARALLSAAMYVLSAGVSVAALLPQAPHMRRTLFLAAACVLIGGRWLGGAAWQRSVLREVRRLKAEGAGDERRLAVLGQLVRPAFIRRTRAQGNASDGLVRPAQGPREDLIPSEPRASARRADLLRPVHERADPVTGARQPGWPRPADTPHNPEDDP